jgi:hypothetical protein
MLGGSGEEGRRWALAVEFGRLSLCTVSVCDAMSLQWLGSSIIPVRSLKAAGFSWSTDASTSMGVRHFWQYSPGPFLSLPMVAVSGLSHCSRRETQGQPGDVAAGELQWVSVSVSMSASAPAWMPGCLDAWMPSSHPQLHVCTASRRVGGDAR